MEGKHQPNKGHSWQTTANVLTVKRKPFLLNQQQDKDAHYCHFCLTQYYKS